MTLEYGQQPFSSPWRIYLSFGIIAALLILSLCFLLKHFGSTGLEEADRHPAALSAMPCFSTDALIVGDELPSMER